MSLIILYLLLVIVLPLALSVGVSYRTLPRGTSCPLCRAETLSLVAPWLRRWSRLLRATELHRRWCLSCGWDGIARVQRTDWALGSLGRDASGEGTAGAGEDAVELCDLEVDGEAWRVLLQCWSEGDRWHGRLLFTAPSGRTWPDPLQSFDGASVNEVLGQALALPEHTLTDRLREVRSD